MKHGLLILSLLLSVYVLAQAPDAGISINAFDSARLKQGHWIERELKIKLNYYRIVNANKDVGQRTELRYFKLAEGEYKEGKKVGSWLDYSNCLNYFDSVNIRENLLGRDTKIDTSQVDGEIYLNIDTVKINCIDGRCVFRTSGEKVFRKFTKSTIETELLNLTTCKYNGIIRKAKRK